MMRFASMAWLAEYTVPLVVFGAIFGGFSVTFGLLAGMAGHLEAVAANRAAAQANDRAAVANEKTKELELELEQARAATARADANLLTEQRLTARERWRLERVERAVLPRSNYVNWEELVAALKEEHFQPINVAIIGGPEARQFGLNLEMALTRAGMMGRVVEPPTDPKALRSLPDSSTGVTALVANPEGEKLAELLWRKYQIGGGSMSLAALIQVWPDLPRDVNCLLVRDDGWAMAPGSGQSGEGIDQYGRPIPAPNDPHRHHLRRLRGACRHDAAWVGRLRGRARTLAARSRFGLVSPSSISFAPFEATAKATAM